MFVQLSPVCLVKDKKQTTRDYRIVKKQCLTSPVAPPAYIQVKNFNLTDAGLSHTETPGFEYQSRTFYVQDTLRKGGFLFDCFVYFVTTVAFRQRKSLREKNIVSKYGKVLKLTESYVILQTLFAKSRE